MIQYTSSIPGQEGGLQGGREETGEEGTWSRRGGWKICRMQRKTEIDSLKRDCNEKK